MEMAHLCVWGGTNGGTRPLAPHERVAWNRQSALLLTDWLCLHMTATGPGSSG